MVLHPFVCLCNVLHFVFELTVCLLYLLQLHVCLCGLTVAAHTMLQQHRGHSVCVHPDVNVSYLHYIARTNDLHSSIGPDVDMHECSLMTTHP